MNFKERLRQALRNPNKFGAGGYIENAGGGDQIVYGSRHYQGGVTRDSNTELEGGGFDAQGNPKAGEVITTIYDDGGNPQEFYMSYKNGVAQDYLAAKERAGGQLNQAQKQEFAKQNESMNPNGSPTDIAANGGMSKEYGFGGGAFSAISDIEDRTGVSPMGGVVSYMQDGGMRKYFMGGMQALNDPREQEMYGQSVDRRSGYLLENGGKKLYHNGGEGPGHPHDQGPVTQEYIDKLDAMDNDFIPSIQDNTGYQIPEHQDIPGFTSMSGDHGYRPSQQPITIPVDGNKEKGYYVKDGNGNPVFVPDGGSVLYQGKPKQGTLDKTLDVLANPLAAFGEYTKYGELKDYFADDESVSNPFDFVTGLVNPAAYVNAIDDLSKKIDEEGITTENAAALTIFAVTRGKIKGGTTKVNQALSNLNTKVNKTAVGRGYNPFSGWSGMGKTGSPTTKTTNVVSKTRSGKVKGVTGSAGNYTGQPTITPMIETVPGVDRTILQRLGNTGKNAGNLTFKTGLYSGTLYGGKGTYNYFTGNSDGVEKDMNYDGLGDGDFSLLNGSNDSIPTNSDTIPVTPTVEIEDLGTTDSIPYNTAVGDTIQLDGVSWERLNELNDSTSWKRVE
jgi:hypothetical protein